MLQFRILLSICLGFMTFGIINLWIDIKHINIIMAGLSIYAFLMSLGQFFYKVYDFQILTKESTFIHNFGKVGEFIITYSIVFTILLMTFLTLFYNDIMDKIADTTSIFALAMVFSYIATYER